MDPIKKYFNGEEGKIKDGFEYGFNVSENGLYLIEIVASSKSWWQNFKKLRIFFRDDDLTVKLNNTEFPKLNGKRGLFDGEVAWNGNILKGLHKTNVFIVDLSKGSHKLTFLVDQKPTLKSIKIEKVNDEINYIPQENNPAEDGDRRQWLNIALVDLPLKRLFVSAIANYNPAEKDGDDMKLIIDGEIKKNEIRKDFKYWYWCGMELRGKEKEFSEELDKGRGLHYIELWADKSPELKNIKLNLGLNLENIDSDENKKRIPTVDAPEWTGDFNDDTEQMILARAIFGEARNMLLSDETRIAVGWSIRNRIGNSAWGNNYHEVILHKNHYSAFRESDKNWDYVKNPLFKNNIIDKRSWEDCYKISGQVIDGSLDDPTDGANHYYDDSIETPYWAAKDNFKIKIDSIFFHRL
jgi:hypothetical protein